MSKNKKVIFVILIVIAILAIAGIVFVKVVCPIKRYNQICPIKLVPPITNILITGDECKRQNGRILNTLAGATCASSEINIGTVEGMDCPCVCCVKKDQSQVTVTTDKTEYKQEHGEIIKITIKNSFNESIWYKLNKPPSCSQDLPLFDYNGKNWSQVPILPFLPPVGCNIEIKELKKGETSAFEYHPSDWHDLKLLKFIKYKFIFEYSEKAEGEEYKKVYSNEFTIKCPEGEVLQGCKAGLCCCPINAKCD